MTTPTLRTAPPVPPVDANPPACRRCPASIRFYQRVGGEPTPFDLGPRPDGTHIYVGDDQVMTLKQGREAGYDVDGAEKLMTHFATCPAAAAFRKAKRS